MVEFRIKWVPHCLSISKVKHVVYITNTEC